MGKKIFISYKYGDSLVRSLPLHTYSTRARHYVDIIQSKLENTDHIYKGEDDGEDLGSLADSTIGSKLGDKIFDSTVTIVLISKGMKENTFESDQWIPWEISYSLREQSRQGRNSKTNAILGVVIPDNTGSYDWYYQEHPECNCTTHFTEQLFTILKKNMFNLKETQIRTCNGLTIQEGEFSFIKTVKWDDFIISANSIDSYVEKALEIWRNRDKYDIRKSV